jgi:hypothetical protein
MGPSAIKVQEQPARRAKYDKIQLICPNQDQVQKRVQSLPKRSEKNTVL